MHHHEQEVAHRKGKCIIFLNPLWMFNIHICLQTCTQTCDLYCSSEHPGEAGLSGEKHAG